MDARDTMVRPLTVGPPQVTFTRGNGEVYIIHTTLAFAESVNRDYPAGSVISEAQILNLFQRAYLDARQRRERESDGH